MSLTERRAVFVYEAARLEAIASKRPIVPELWVQRDESFRSQFLKCIERICVDGYATTPQAEHDSWRRAYIDMGWRYGPIRDVVAKTHPDMVSYDELLPVEREKDAVFLALCQVATQYIRGI